MPTPSTTETGPARTRDSDATRRVLLQAARRRFALDGYRDTTVRAIAKDAGVNGALINRYFTSKEGLFEACITRMGEELGAPEVGAASVDQVVRVLVEQLRAGPGDERSLQLLLLLRSSGDARAEQIRRDILLSFAQRMAAAVAPEAPLADSEALLLRAEIALSAALGIALLRASTGLEPLTSAADEELAAPLGDLFSALLTGGPMAEARPTPATPAG